MNYTNQFTLPLFFLFLSLLISCDEKPQLDTKAISKEVKNRKITRVSQADILELASGRGNILVSEIEVNWKKALKNGLEEKGKEYSKKFCIVPFIPGIDTILQKATSIKKLGWLNNGKFDKPDSLEIQIREAYSYNVEHNISLAQNVQRYGKEYVLYTSPIKLDDKMCFHCHSSEVPETSKNNYTGFWSIKFSKKQLIESKIKP